jgi:hypothetical protein
MDNMLIGVIIIGVVVLWAIISRIENGCTGDCSQGRECNCKGKDNG